MPEAQIKQCPLTPSPSKEIYVSIDQLGCVVLKPVRGGGIRKREMIKSTFICLQERANGEFYLGIPSKLKRKGGEVGVTII